MRHKLILAGGGSGTAEYLLPAAKKALEEVELVIASPRFLELLHARKTMPMGHISELLESLPAMLERESIGIVVSGDPLLYSLCRTLRNRYPELEMQVIPGVGSLQLLGAAFGLTMEQAKICSIHGRAYHAGTIACTVSEHAETFFFCSRTQGPREIAAALLAYGLSDTEIFVGADLTYPTQKLWHGTPAQAAELDDPELCVAAVRNPAPKPVTRLGLLPDSAFLRNRSPMTKEEVRAVILSKLRLKPDAVIWDLGAGTGSVSIECARMCPFGEVYAVEYKPEALDILEQNKTRFQTKNLHHFAHDNGPREHEHRFHVENQEQNREQVIPYPELHPRFTARRDAAFVGLPFLFVERSRREPFVETECRHYKKYCRNNNDQQ